MDKINKQYFHSAYMRLYRRLMKLPHDKPMSDEEVSVILGLPQPTTVLRVARLRLSCSSLQVRTCHTMGSTASRLTMDGLAL